MSALADTSNKAECPTRCGMECGQLPKIEQYFDCRSRDTKVQARRSEAAGLGDRIKSRGVCESLGLGLCLAFPEDRVVKVQYVPAAVARALRMLSCTVGPEPAGRGEDSSATVARYEGTMSVVSAYAQCMPIRVQSVHEGRTSSHRVIRCQYAI